MSDEPILPLPLATRAKTLVLSRPQGPARQLILLYHGLDANPRQMAPLGQALARAYPEAWVVSVCAPMPSGQDTYQWYAAQDLNDENRLQRVKDALPDFLNSIRYWQAQATVGPEGTALIGFSEGAIMALESSHETPLPAARVVSIGGRFLRLPEPVSDAVTYFLLHGKQDQVVPYGYTVTAAEYLVARRGDVVADVVPFLGHEIAPELIDLLIERLQGHIPRRLWDEALKADAPLRRRED